MDRIINDGSVQAHIFDDFSIFTLENTIVGQYSSKINKGSYNTIIGTNAGKIGLQLNNSIIIGANTDQELLNANKLISIGEHSITSRYINETINIGYYNGNSNNINIDNLDINYLNDKLINQDLIKLDLNDIITSNNNAVYLGVGKFKDTPIIFSSKRNFNNTTNFFIEGSLNTELLKLKNNDNYYISLINNQNSNIIYTLPQLPFYEQAYLSTDINGNLEWLEITDMNINIIQSSADIICEGLNAINLKGNGTLLKNLNLSELTTDNLKEGLANIYFNTSLITNIFFNSFITNFIICN